MLYEWIVSTTFNSNNRMNRVCNSYGTALIPQGFVLTFITVCDLSMSFSVVNGGDCCITNAICKRQSGKCHRVNIKCLTHMYSIQSIHTSTSWRKSLSYMNDDLIVFCLSNIVAKFTIIMKQRPGCSWLKYVNPPWNMLAPSTINDRWDISNQLTAAWQ